MRSIYALLLTLALTPLAGAQSLDCKLAQSPREHTICANNRLTALDADVTSAYKSLVAHLSPESAAGVESDQHEWSRWIDLICPAKSKTDDLFRCLQDQYTVRARDLKQTPHLGTAIIFPRCHFLYKAGNQFNKLPAPEYRGFGYGSLRWPQIDIKPDRKTDPLTPSEAMWNKVVEAHAAKVGAGIFNSGENVTFDTTVNALEDLEADYTVEAANNRLIEVSFIVASHVWVSGASPLTIRSSFLWWFGLNRELAIDDVFVPLSAWQEFLVSVATARLHANPRLKPLLRDDSTLEEAVRQSVPQTSNWTLTQNGLTITFLQGTVAANSAGMPRVFISWNDLNPFLAPDLDPSTLPIRFPAPAP